MTRRLCWSDRQWRLWQKHGRGRGKKVRRALAVRVGDSDDKGYSEGSEQRSSRSVGNGLERKETVAVGLKERQRRQRVGPARKRALGPTSGWQAVRAATDVTTEGRLAIAVYRSRGGGGRLL
ncbi:hypothetical protein BHE74_00053007 [Ensete ventricosum]|nr:hypothetical protein BHE74_00053007 [Ensete ventricosum]